MAILQRQLFILNPFLDVDGNTSTPPSFPVTYCYLLLPTWLHLTQVFSLLPSGSSERLWHTMQPETWMAACFLGSSVWAATSVLASAEDTAFYQVDTIAKHFLGG